MKGVPFAMEGEVYQMVTFSVKMVNKKGKGLYLGAYRLRIKRYWVPPPPLLSSVFEICIH